MNFLTALYVILNFVNFVGGGNGNANGGGILFEIFLYADDFVANI
jgi:hypothetical protein